MCACDNVKVNPSSLIMIHKCWSFLFGGYNADELRNMAKTNDAYDKSQISIYQRKTSLSETILSHMMSDTTYMTGQEALDKGFADEIMEDVEPLNIAASADGRTLFVKGRQMHLAPGMFAPDNIPTVNPESNVSDKTNNINQQANPAAKKGGKTMANTVEELRKEYPELTAQLETEAKASANNEAVADAIKAERDRIEKIDEVASLFDEELVKTAKYGENACSAQELAYRAAQKAAKNGQKFMANLEDDAGSSGAGDVGAVPGQPANTEDLTEEQKQAQVKAEIKKLLGKEKED